MSRICRFILFSTIIVTFVIGLSGYKGKPAIAAGEKYKARLGSAQSLYTPGWIAAGKILKPLAEAKTKGRLEIGLYGGGQLGSTKQQLDMVSSGSLDMTFTTGIYLSRMIPWMSLFDLPFNWDNSTEFLATNYRVIKVANEKLKPRNMVILGAALAGTRGFVGNKLIRTPEDCKGLVFRYHAAGVGPKFAEQFGGKPVVFGWKELYTAFEQGTIDMTTCAPPISVISAKLAEVVKYFSVSNHAYVTLYYIANTKWFNGLPNDIRETLVDSVQVACDWANAEVQRKEAGAYEALQNKYGVKVYYFTPEEKAKFKALTPAVYKFAEEKYGKDTLELFLVKR